jgi:FkbH-like protein
VGWTPKPDALRSLADELGFGLDSFIFLDDNPVERGAVRSGCPEVLTPELPRDPAAIPGFLRGLWALDPRRVTTEDRRRTSLHREESAREEAQLAARSLDDFLAGLELEVGFAPLSAESAARAAQLTQRTNQLNVTTRRRTEAELAALARSGALTGLVIDVRDRFGDYGTVGLLLFAITPDALALAVDTLLLSCRALGRGVEQRLLAHLGQLAVAHGCARVDVPFVATARNRPALDLLEAAGAEHREADGEGWIFRFPAASLGAIRRLERERASRPTTENAAKETAPSPAAVGPSAAAQQARRLEHIADALADVPSILAAIHAQRSGRSARSGGPAPAVAPAGAVEQGVAAIWCEVLHLADVSASAVFFALGGDSVAMVRVISRLRDAFGVELTPGQFFGAPTIQGLARTIAGLDEAVPAPVAAAADDDDDDLALLALIEGLSTTEVSALLAPTSSAAVGASAGALTIASIGVVTANRPEALLRALESYAENARHHGRAPDLVVVDDSRAPAMRAANRGALAALSRARGASRAIRYAGTEEKEAFLRALGAFDVPPDVARFALLPDVTDTTTVGANRNALLLDAVGDLVFSADDDTLCRLAAPPDSDPALDDRAAVGRDPCDYWFFRDHAAALRAVSPVDRDLLAAHEELLGHDAQSLRAGEPAGPVLITLGGIVGDCGWGAPFGWWLGPMGYLAMRGPSLARLFAEASVSGDPCTSRAILRVARRPSLADETMSMTTTVGLDARGLLPPFCPFGRGEDNIFGASIAACVPGARFGHVPWAVVHAPAEERRFWPGELARTASGVDASRVLIELIRAWDPGDIASPEGRIRALGQHLVELGKARGADFDHLVRARLAASDRALVSWLEEGLAAPGAPAWWVDETRRYLTALGRAEARDDHAVPLDLRGAGGVDEGRARTAGFVRRMGELYVHWPAMVAGARALRARGHRLGLAVAASGRVQA